MMDLPQQTWCFQEQEPNMLVLIIAVILVLLAIEAFLLFKLTNIVQILQQRQDIIDMKLDTLAVFVTYDPNDEDSSSTLQ